jgi:HK97 family phage major capsid protein
MTITQLLQKRAAIHAQMSEAIKKRDKLRTESGDNAAGQEYEQEFDRADAEYNSLSREIQQRQRLEEIERQEAAQHLSDLDERGALPKDPGQQRDYRSAFEEYVKYGERMSAEGRALLEQRGTDNQIVGTPGLGGYLVPQGFLPELVKAMKDYSGIYQAARILNTDSGNPLMIPTEDDTATVATLVAEAGNRTVQDVTFNQKRLDAFAYQTLAKVSWELMQDSAFDLETEIRNMFGIRFGRAINLACTTGTGSDQPQGVVGAATLGKAAASQTAITFAEVMDLLHAVDPAYRSSPSCGFMLHDQVLAVLKKIQLGSGDTTPLWLPSVRESEPDKILGFRYWINQAMEPALTTNKRVMLFGDFSKFVIRMVKGITVMRLNELYSQNGLVGFNGFMRFDSECLNTAAIKYLTTKVD